MKMIIAALAVVACFASFMAIDGADETDAAVTYTLAYNANGGTGAPATQTYGPTDASSHTFYNPSTIPTRENYTFRGWAFSSTSPNPSSDAGDPVVLYSGAPNKTLYAVWVADEGYVYSLSFSANGGYGAPSTQTAQSTALTYTFTIPYTTPFRSNYDFLGWHTNPNATTASYQPGNTISTSNTNPALTLYAVWEYDPPAPSTYTYYMSYDANGGTGAPSTQSYGPTTDTSHTFTIPNTVPTRDNYTFLGWASSSTSINPSSGPGDNITLYAGNPTRTMYAVWQAATITYTLTYNANGGTGAPSTYTGTSSQTTYTFTISDIVPTRDNFTFLGWANTSSSQSADYLPGDSLTTSSNNPYITIFAVWEAAQITYTLSYDANGGTGAPSMQSYGPTHDSIHNFVIPNDVPTRDSYSFRGWAFSSTSLYPSVGPGMTVMLQSENPHRTLYAVWGSAISDNVYWSNNLQNGTVSIAFKFAGSNNMSHNMSIPLYDAVFDDQNRATWTQTGETLNISVSYPATIIASLNNQDPQTISLGNWSGFILTINFSQGAMTFVPMDTFADFTSYTLLESQATTIYTWNAQGKTAYSIQHYDTGNGRPVKFSVVNTWTYLDTFGVVLNNPHINVNDYFPQYQKVRVNLYAFAVYGEAMMINGKSWDVVGSNITITYTVGDDGVNHWAAEGTAGAEIKSMTLSNISITWDGTNCWLSSNTDGFIVDLGSYSNASKTFSFTGLWYFTATLDQPYTATQTVVSGEWESLLDIDATAVIMLFLGIVIAAGLFCHVKFRMKWLDGVIIIVAIITAFVLLG